MYETLQWNVSPTLPTSVWVSKAQLGTQASWYEFGGNRNFHKYFKALGWYSWTCVLLSVSATKLLIAPRHISSFSLLPKRRINSIWFPRTPLWLVIHSQHDAGVLRLCVHAHLSAQGLQGLLHKRVKAASQAQEMPSWRVHEHETGRANSQFNSC